MRVVLVSHLGIEAAKPVAALHPTRGPYWRIQHGRTPSLRRSARKPHENAAKSQSHGSRSGYNARGPSLKEDI